MKNTAPPVNTVLEQPFQESQVGQDFIIYIYDGESITVGCRRYDECIQIYKSALVPTFANFPHRNRHMLKPNYLVSRELRGSKWALQVMHESTAVP